jgi:hypothetical protein
MGIARHAAAAVTDADDWLVTPTAQSPGGSRLVTRSMSVHKSMGAGRMSAGSAVLVSRNRPVQERLKDPCLGQLVGIPEGTYQRQDSAYAPG